MATIVQNATASLTARGTTTATGSISWSVPPFPSYVSTWDNVTISGTWTWKGKGNVSRVTINGVNTSNGIPFDINISGKTSPLSITCVGNKNATGSSFTWQNLIVTYTYTEPSSEQMMIKINGSWVNVSEVYKKQNGIWVSQSDLSSLFDTSTNYVKEN